MINKNIYIRELFTVVIKKRGTQGQPWEVWKTSMRRII